MKKRVLIVGIGALGSHVAVALRNDAELTVVDFDRVAAKNCLAQFHCVGTVGANKAEALRRTLLYLWKIRVRAIPHALTETNIDTLAGSADLVIDCVDRGEPRRVMQGYARRTSTACLHGALAAGGELGRVVWNELFVVDDVSGGAATCEDGAFLPFIQLVSSYIALAAQAYLATKVKRGYQVLPSGLTVVI